MRVGFHRWFVALTLLVSSAAGCAARPAEAPATPPVELHLDPACDLAPSAGLRWLVEAKPRAIAEIPDLIPAIARVLPEARLQAFTKAQGGVDPRQIKDLCIAHYEDSTLSIARLPIDPERVAASFESRSSIPVTRTLLAPNPRVLRMNADVGGEPRRLLVFGHEGLAIEYGSASRLRAAEAFAFKKLKRAAPATKGAALRRASELLGDDALVRVFVPGPFEGDTAAGLGGLMRAATAIGLSARWAETGANISIHVVLTGAWGSQGPAAAERLAAATHVLSESALGHLLGLHRPVTSPTVHVDSDDALVLETTIDGMALARGIHDAVDAEVAEIMSR